MEGQLSGACASGVGVASRSAGELKLAPAETTKTLLIALAAREQRILETKSLRPVEGVRQAFEKLTPRAPGKARRTLCYWRPRRLRRWRRVVWRSGHESGGGRLLLPRVIGRFRSEAGECGPRDPGAFPRGMNIPLPGVLESEAL